MAAEDRRVDPRVAITDVAIITPAPIAIATPTREIALIATQTTPIAAIVRVAIALRFSEEKLLSNPKLKKLLTVRLLPGTIVLILKPSIYFLLV